MRRIGVASCVPYAGSRFFCSNFACYLAAEEGRRPAVLELASPGLYDALGMDKRFAGRTFFPPGGPPNVAAGVNWQLLKEERCDTDDKNETERFYRRLRTLDRTEGDVILCLLNGLSETERNLFLREIDVYLLIIDPLPSRLLLSYDVLRRKEEKEPLRIVNKMNAGVKNRELSAFLGERQDLSVPLVPGEEICRAEYACVVPYERKSVAALLRPSFRIIWNRL